MKADDNWASGRRRKENGRGEGVEEWGGKTSRTGERLGSSLCTVTGKQRWVCEILVSSIF